MGREAEAERREELVRDFSSPIPLAQRSPLPSADGAYTFSMPTTRRDAAMALRPLPEPLALQAHLHSLAHRGYTILPAVIQPPLLAQLRERFDALIGRAQRGECASGGSDAAGIVEVARVYEEEPAFEALMALPPVLALAQAALGVEPRLHGGPYAHYVPPRTGSDMAWHRDGDPEHGGWLRLTYTLDDLEPGGGGTSLMPGSHRWEPTQPVPEWANDAATGAACELPGRDEFCAPAGSCMVSWTLLWHARPPNLSERARRVFWQLYRRPEQPTWHSAQHLLSQEYFAAQAAVASDERKLLLVRHRPPFPQPALALACTLKGRVCVVGAGDRA